MQQTSINILLYFIDLSSAGVGAKGLSMQFPLHKRSGLLTLQHLHDVAKTDEGEFTSQTWTAERIEWMGAKKNVWERDTRVCSLQLSSETTELVFTTS